MARSANGWQYTKGLHDLGNGCYGYLQPDGSWGWSNAGLVVDGGESLLVDTLFDLKLTRAMLDTMRSAEPKATARIGALVNTHSNGDHDYCALSGDQQNCGQPLHMVHRLGRSERTAD
jgi:cyclase